MVEQGLTSHQTRYRSYRGRFLQVIWPNQQCQSTQSIRSLCQWNHESYWLNQWGIVVPLMFPKQFTNLYITTFELLCFHIMLLIQRHLMVVYGTEPNMNIFGSSVAKFEFI